MKMKNDVKIWMVDGSHFEYKTNLSADEFLLEVEKRSFIKLHAEEFISDVIVNTRNIVSIIVTESED